MNVCIFFLPSTPLRLLRTGRPRRHHEAGIDESDALMVGGVDGEE
jgi:hypothetical protein